MVSAQVDVFKTLTSRERKRMAEKIYRNYYVEGVPWQVLFEF